MQKFEGFPAGKVRFTRLPGPFFTELLPQIDDLDEMKVTLYILWQLEQMEGDFRYLTPEAMLDDPTFLTGFEDESQLQAGLLGAVERGTLLHASIELEGEQRSFYFLNSPRGQAAIQAIGKGQWQPGSETQQPIELGQQQPNVFRLYEEHIGPLTPLLAETLTEAENTYPPTWIEDAMRIAVENNVRRWRYVQAILESWQREGKDERTDRRRTEKDRRKYVEGEFSEFIES
ncbi:MAG: DnaD domain protein [Chloroflexi bacterium]|nr:MAG: DnaD domain protein [Chloroflexota bacterium]MBL1197271.1 DnaD domain protein [Chloroflexota bacterium]NOH14566.1 DnaD domain protein [Chloroflexota bacterium]